VLFDQIRLAEYQIDTVRVHAENLRQFFRDDNEKPPSEEQLTEEERENNRKYREGLDKS
jgi:hypothetical protein